MKILLISATRAELEPLHLQLQSAWERYGDNRFRHNDKEIHHIVSGVGLMAATYALTMQLAEEQYDLVVQAGIAGAYDRSLGPGEVVFVSKELLGDTGAEDRYQFLDIFDLGLASIDQIPFHNKTLINPMQPDPMIAALKSATGLSVNLTAGTAYTAELRQRKYGCTIESMEGAALHYVCLLRRQAFVQIRSISNYVEARDRSGWKIPEAVQALNHWLWQWLHQDLVI